MSSPEIYHLSREQIIFKFPPALVAVCPAVGGSPMNWRNTIPVAAEEVRGA